MAPPLRRQVLRTFKQVCYAAKDLPDQELGRRQLWTIKAWLRKTAPDWDAKCFAHLRYALKELEATIKLAKYRAMKRRYYDE
mmetsp:Transcript_64156/g.167917  ORF Transcript_64156/g.167917 Transcript_64156/m.167917 type:complete len:82 (-) Transcript_64156:371-616(-)